MFGIEEVLDRDGYIWWVVANGVQRVEEGLKALESRGSLAVWIESEEDDLGMLSEFLGKLGHASFFAGSVKVSMPMLVALAADDESGRAEDEVGSLEGASSECLEGLVFAHGRRMEALCEEVGPEVLDSGGFAGGFLEAGLADVYGVERYAGVSESEACLAEVRALIMDEFLMLAQMVGACEGLEACVAVEPQLFFVHGEGMSEEMVGARKDGGTVGAGKGPKFAVDDVDVSLEMIFTSGSIGTLRALHRRWNVYYRTR